MRRFILAATLLLTTASAYAGGVTQLPEPGTFELLALGGIVAAIAAVRNRRKK